MACSTDHPTAAAAPRARSLATRGIRIYQPGTQPNNDVSASAISRIIRPFSRISKLSKTPTPSGICQGRLTRCCGSAGYRIQPDSRMFRAKYGSVMTQAVPRNRKKVRTSRFFPKSSFVTGFTANNSSGAAASFTVTAQTASMLRSA